jgi:hypothetical protein
MRPIKIATRQSFGVERRKKQEHADRQIARRRAFLVTGGCLALGTFFLPKSAFADDMATEECKKIIESQIRAFMEADHATAYSFASPVVKQMYPDPASFAAMVKRGYAAVYAPQTYSFGRATKRDGQQIQEVQLTDKQGKNWVALYTLSDFDGEWRITGVFLQRSKALPT